MTVNENTNGQHRSPALAIDDGDRLVVAWEDDSDRDDVNRILVRGFNASGTQRFADMAITAVADGPQYRPDISMAEDGRFVLVWEGDRDDNGSYQIRGLGMTRDGGEWLALHTYNEDPDGQQRDPQVALHSSGSQVCVWEDDIDGNGYYQILANGTDWSVLSMRARRSPCVATRTARPGRGTSRSQSSPIMTVL